MKLDYITYQRDAKSKRCKIMTMSIYSGENEVAEKHTKILVEHEGNNSVLQYSKLKIQKGGIR